jgi:hypothetical protein
VQLPGDLGVRQVITEGGEHLGLAGRHLLCTER